MFALVAASCSALNSHYFEDVTIHRGQPPVTIQVAWKLDKELASPPAAPVIISVFSGTKGSRTLVSTKTVGTCEYGPNPQLIHDPKSGETFVSVSVDKQPPVRNSLFGFVGTSVFHLKDGDFFAENGQLQQSAQAKEFGFVVPKGHYANPFIVRPVSYNTETRTLSYGDWKIGGPFPNVYESTTIIRGKSVKVRFESQYFQSNRRKFTFDAKKMELRVDGQKAYGHDYNEEDFKRTPSTEIVREELKTFKVWIDGKDVFVPKHLWSTCFEPNLGKLYIKTIPGPNGSIEVSMTASDGAGGYTATWIRSKNGKWSRDMNHEC